MARARHSKRTTKRCRGKGCASRTRKGRKNFITHKGSKYYNRRGHRQTRNAKGVKGRPYMLRKGRPSKATPQKKYIFSELLGI